MSTGPLLDMSDAFDDAQILDVFDVLRRKQVVDVNGLAQVTTTRFLNTPGVVTIADPGSLQRSEDAQRMSKGINVVTQFRLQGPAPGFAPDVVTWHSDQYVVMSVGDYAGFGPGFVNATCQSMDIIDQPPPP